MLDDLKMIKKMYGEDMMHLCRNLFPTILETPGLLYSLMEKSFAPDHYLYEDILEEEQVEAFKEYIYSLVKKKEEEESIVTKTPYELMDEAGYTLYECKNEEDIQKFRKYYAYGEELCTFRGGRLDWCHVFFAVKKNVDEIKRDNYKIPERQDEYGTSVISIQFARGNNNILSIKNRYNHRVSNPDATFSNNLDNIIPGLTASFEKMYGFNINQSESSYLVLLNYVQANDGRFYRYNYEINNIYYCPGNIIIDNFEVKKDYQEKEKYIIADYFIIDLVKKEVRLYDENIYDSFIDGFKDIERIKVTKDKNTGNRIITITPSNGEDIVIEIDIFNNIIGYKNNNLVEVGDSFLGYNNCLTTISFPKLERVGDDFIRYNEYISDINLPCIRTVGDDFLFFNQLLNRLNLSNLVSVGSNFLFSNTGITYLLTPKLKVVGNNFLRSNVSLRNCDFSNLLVAGNNFLWCNWGIKVLNLPKLESILDNFMSMNNGLMTLDAPNLRTVGDKFLSSNNCLITLNLPSLESAAVSFLSSNKVLKYLYAPKLRNVGRKFLSNNDSVKNFNLDSLEEFDDTLFEKHRFRYFIVKKIKGNKRKNR